MNACRTYIIAHQGSIDHGGSGDAGRARKRQGLASPPAFCRRHHRNPSNALFANFTHLACFDGLFSHVGRLIIFDWSIINLRGFGRQRTSSGKSSNCSDAIHHHPTHNRKRTTNGSCKRSTRSRQQHFAEGRIWASLLPEIEVAINSDKRDRTAFAPPLSLLPYLRHRGPCERHAPLSSVSGVSFHRRNLSPILVRS